MFEVVSFGTNFEISSKNKRGFENNSENVEKIFKEIDSFNANFGNTNIFDPMEYIIKQFLKYQL